MTKSIHSSAKEAADNINRRADDRFPPDIERSIENDRHPLDFLKFLDDLPITQIRDRTYSNRLC